MKVGGLLLCAVLSVLLSGCGGGGGADGSASSRYSMRELPETYWSEPIINNLGEIAVDAYDDNDGYRQPAIIGPNGTVRKLTRPSVPYWEVTDFSDSEQVVADGDTVGLKWNSTGSVVTLGAAPAYCTCYPAAINRAGCVVGSRRDLRYNTERAVLWSTDGSETELPMLPGYSSSAASDINDDGWIVGYVYNESDQIHSQAVVWTPDGAVRALVQNGSESQGKKISNSGEIIVASLSGWFVCDTSGHIRRTLQPLAGYTYTWALDMNDRGEAVGLAVTPEGPGSLSRAVYWDPAGRIIDLGTAADRPCSAASSINNSGVIVGSASATRTVARGVSVLVWTPK